MTKVICPYCGEPTELVTGNEIYSGSVKKFTNNHYYLCRPCRAFVGCHKITLKPLGIPAKQEVRELRVRAHIMFDSLWKTGKIKSRRLAYKKLALYLKLPLNECHIGLLDTETCKKVITFGCDYPNI